MPVSTACPLSPSPPPKPFPALSEERKYKIPLNPEAKWEALPTLPPETGGSISLPHPP